MWRLGMLSARTGEGDIGIHIDGREAGNQVSKHQGPARLTAGVLWGPAAGQGRSKRISGVDDGYEVGCRRAMRCRGIGEGRRGRLGWRRNKRGRRRHGHRVRRVDGVV